MRIALVLIVGSLLTWLTVLGASPAADRADASPATEGCAVAGVPNGEVPSLSPAPTAELLPEQMPGLQKAYFSMGCFWGSEAMLASCPGVLFTRVGFTGGTLPEPSYSAIGDHVETVEVLFDPAQVSYAQLLEHFWTHHNARAKPIFRQYASALFTVDEKQAKLALEARARREAAAGEPLLTAILPLETFYAAEANHQKYYLSQDPDLLEMLPRDQEQKRQTRLATKLNALCGQAGKRSGVRASLLELGLTPAQVEALFQRVSWSE